MDLSTGSKVQLRSFLGLKEAPPETRDHENYWRLIGAGGVVVNDKQPHYLGSHPMGSRMLVKFEVLIAGLGLECHNEIENSLWIFVADLRQIEARKKGAREH